MIIPPDIGDWRDPQGRAPVDPAIFRLPSACILAVSGQSMPASYAACDYFPPAADTYEWNIGNGKAYPMSGWRVLGATWWDGRISVLPYLTALLRGKYNPVLICPISIGGTDASRWCPSGDLFIRCQALIEQLQESGLTPSKWWHVIGQQDAIEGTTTAGFVGITEWMITALRGLGMNANFLMDCGAYQKYTPQSNIDAIRAGQLQAMQNGQGSCSLGVDQDQYPDDSPTPGSWRVDGVHPANLMRYYWCNAEAAIM